MSILKFRRRNDGLHVADALTERIPQVPRPERYADGIPLDPYDAATRETLARLVAQVEAEAAHEGDPTQTWAKPDDLLPDHRDTWATLARNYVRPADATLPAPPMPYSGISAIWVAQITYPDPGDLSYYQARDYRETLRHIGAATGTSTSLEDTGSWPRPALEAGDAS